MTNRDKIALSTLINYVIMNNKTALYVRKDKTYKIKLEGDVITMVPSKRSPEPIGICWIDEGEIFYE